MAVVSVPLDGTLRDRVVASTRFLRRPVISDRFAHGLGCTHVSSRGVCLPPLAHNGGRGCSKGDIIRVEGLSVDGRP